MAVSRSYAQRFARMHFIGIGGVGMSGLARVYSARGARVSGSDLADGPALASLRRAGIDTRVGHASSAVADTDAVVYSSAIPEDNPELVAARAANIPVIHRGALLAELMRPALGIAVCGSHGKTTTTALIGSVLEAGGLDPTVLVGGRVRAWGQNAREGVADLVVAEADESDGSFLELRPAISVITNIDREHLDHHGSFDALLDAFAAFGARVPHYGAAILCVDDAHVRRILGRIPRRLLTYGFSTHADVAADRVRADGLAMRFELRVRGRAIGPVEIPLPGRHNVQNALAALAVGLELDVPFAVAAEALRAFGGVARRFELRGERDGVTAIDDYSHHPAEVAACLRAARQSDAKRVVVVFQPHRYTRTRDVFDALAQSFHDADVLVLTDIYAAGQEPIAGIDAEALAEAVRADGHRAVEAVGPRKSVVPALRRIVRKGDWVIFMGAGDIGRLADDFLADRGGEA